MLHFLREFVSFLPLGENYYRNQLKLLMSLPHEGMEVAEIFGVAAATTCFAATCCKYAFSDKHWHLVNL